MDAKILEEKLRILGLTEREIPVYKVLLQVKQAKVSDIAEWTGIYRPTVYTLLKGLIERGCVIRNKGHVTYFRAVSPATAFRTLMEQRRQELIQGEKFLDELENLFLKREDTGTVSEGIEVLTLNHGELVLEWLNRAQNEVLSIHTTLTPRRKPLLKRVKMIDRIELDKLARGVRFRCLYSPMVISNEFEKKRIQRHVETGEQARCHPELPMIFVVIDNGQAIFTMYSGSSTYTTYLVTAPALIQVFKLAFETLWSQAVPVMFSP